MAGEVTAKIRFVRCPRCRAILPELTPVYQCGGCGTILQAKKRKNEATDTRSQIQETNTIQKNELTNVSDCKEAQSMSQGETATSGELPLENNFGSDQKEIQDSNGEQSGDIKFSSELTKPICHVNDESSSAAREETSLEQSSGEDQNEYGYCNGKLGGGLSFSDEVASSTEVTHHESEESSPVAGAHSEKDLEQINGGAQNEYAFCNGKPPGGLNFSYELASSTENCNRKSEESLPIAGAHSDRDLEQKNGRAQNEYGYCNGNGPESSTELNRQESEESSPVAGVHSEEDLEQKNGSAQNDKYGYCNGKRPGGVSFSDELASSTGFNHNGSEELSPTGVHSEVDENSNCLEQDNGNMKFSNEISSSTELVCQEIEESFPMGETSTEFDEKFNRFIFGSLSGENLPASSPRDSFTSSQRPLGGERNLTKNQMAPYNEQMEQSQKRAPNGFDSVSSEDSLESFSIPSSKSHVKFKDMPKFPTRSYYADDGSVSSYDGTDERVSHLVRRKFKESESACTKGMPRRDEVMNTVAWNCSSISSENEHYAMKGSNWREDELVGSTRNGHPVRNRMRFETDEHRSKEPFYSRGYQIGSEKGSPSNYGKNDFEYGKNFHSPKKSDYLEEEKMKLLKMVYELQDQLNRTHIEKGKANGRFSGFSGTEKQIPSYYDYTSSDMETSYGLNDTRYSGRNWAHPNRTLRIPFSAEATTSRQPINHFGFHNFPLDWQSSAPLPPYMGYNKSQYAGSEFSMSCDERSEVVRDSRERPHSAKKHLLPVAGAAPFLLCYNCSKLLQIPADFLLFRRKWHQLKCSSCGEVLKFSLQNRTQIVPYTDFTSDAIAAPPNYVDDFGSSSDGFGQSLRQSCSTDGEPFSVTPPFHGQNRKMPSGSSFEPMKGREKRPIFKESSSKKSKAEKLSSEIKELPPKAGSPLHRLMGYSSARQILDS